MHTVNVGDSTVTVESIGNEWQPWDQAFRQRYSYSIVTPEWRFDGDDIRSGVGANVDEADAARSLFSFLGAAAEAYRAVTFDRRASENIDLFPPHVNEWAYMNDDEIGLLALDEEDRS